MSSTRFAATYGCGQLPSLLDEGVRRPVPRRRVDKEKEKEKEKEREKEKAGRASDPSTPQLPDRTVAQFPTDDSDSGRESAVGPSSPRSRPQSGPLSREDRSPTADAGVDGAWEESAGECEEWYSVVEAQCPCCESDLRITIESLWPCALAPDGRSAGGARGTQDAAANAPFGGRGEEDDDAAKTGTETFREKVWACMELGVVETVPYLLISRIVAMVSIVFVLLSIANFAAETCPQFYENPPPAIFQIEAICIGYFTLELFLRAYGAPDRPDFFWDRYTVVDILSVLPFYVGIMVGSGAAKGILVVRLLRLMRIFRVFKVSRYNEAVQVVMESLQRSTEGLYLLLFLIMLSMMVFSSAMYFAEREVSHYDSATERWYIDWDAQAGPAGSQKSPYQSIIHTFWWCLITLTTVGYGDEVPSSIGGKFVACLTMLVGTIVIAFPMIIIGQQFQESYDRYRSTRQRRGFFGSRKAKKRGSAGEAHLRASMRQLRKEESGSAGQAERDGAERQVPTPPSSIRRASGGSLASPADPLAAHSGIRRRISDPSDTELASNTLVSSTLRNGDERRASHFTPRQRRASAAVRMRRRMSSRREGSDPVSPEGELQNGGEPAPDFRRETLPCIVATAEAGDAAPSLQSPLSDRGDRLPSTPIGPPSGDRVPSTPIILPAPAAGGGDTESRGGFGHRRRSIEMQTRPQLPVLLSELSTALRQLDGARISARLGAIERRLDMLHVSPNTEPSRSPIPRLAPVPDISRMGRSATVPV